MAGRPAKWPQELVEKVREARNVENRKVDWIAERYGVPVDTVRDWVYRGRRATPHEENARH